MHVKKGQEGSSTLFGAYTLLFTEVPISQLDYNDWVRGIKRDEGRMK